LPLGVVLHEKTVLSGLVLLASLNFMAIINPYNATQIACFRARYGRIFAEFHISTLYNGRQMSYTISVMGGASVLRP